MPARVLWEAEDTSVDAVAAALARLAAGADTEPAGGRRRARARALTLVALADRAERPEAEAIARLAMRHPLRAVVVVADPGAPPGLHARIRRYSHPRSPEAVAAEEVELRVGGRGAGHLAGVVEPLLLPELPAVLWSAGAPALGSDSFLELRALCDRTVIDLAAAGDLAGTLAALEHPETVDELCWVRTLPWRDRVAALFDPPEHRPAAAAITRVRIRHRMRGRVAALLLGGWIGSRLGLPAAEISLEAAESPTEVTLAGAERTYRVRAFADGEHAALHRAGEPPERVRLKAFTSAEAVDAVLGAPPDPLWPPALAVAARLAGGGGRV